MQAIYDKIINYKIHKISYNLGYLTNDSNYVRLAKPTVARGNSLRVKGELSNETIDEGLGRV